MVKSAYELVFIVLGNIPSPMFLWGTEDYISQSYSKENRILGMKTLIKNTFILLLFSFIYSHNWYMLNQYKY